MCVGRARERRGAVDSKCFRAFLHRLFNKHKHAHTKWRKREIKNANGCPVDGGSGDIGRRREEPRAREPFATLPERESFLIKISVL